MINFFYLDKERDRIDNPFLAIKARFVATSMFTLPSFPLSSPPYPLPPQRLIEPS